jgi:hypothetical protein
MSVGKEGARSLTDTTLYTDVRMSVLRLVQEHYPALLYSEALEIAEAAARKADSGARLAYLAATQ